MYNHFFQVLYLLLENGDIVLLLIVNHVQINEFFALHLFQYVFLLNAVGTCRPSKAVCFNLGNETVVKL